jgi:hypothetical protein
MATARPMPLLLPPTRALYPVRFKFIFVKSKKDKVKSGALLNPTNLTFYLVEKNAFICPWQKHRLLVKTTGESKSTNARF